ncbi:MAG: FixH family protein [Sterolibacterium sp.]
MKPDILLLPWYRHRWPWFLMAGPAIVVVASFITLWLAIASNDGLVTEDYYKKGLAINQTLSLNERAQELGLRAGVSLKMDSISVRIASRASDFVLPSQIRVTVSHPTRAGLDQSQILTLVEGRYAGRFKLPEAGHWVVLVEDNAKTWRMTGNVMLPASGETVFGAMPQVAAPVAAPLK